MVAQFSVSRIAKALAKQQAAADAKADRFIAWVNDGKPGEMGVGSDAESVIERNGKS